MHTNFYDNIIFKQRQLSTTLAEMSDLLLLWKVNPIVTKIKNSVIEATFAS